MRCRFHFTWRMTSPLPVLFRNSVVKMAVAKPSASQTSDDHAIAIKAQSCQDRCP